MQQHRMMKRYNTLLISIVCIAVAICAVTAWWAQPLNGDLTRIGGYPERWFGWTEPQQRNPLNNRTARTPDKPHILVIGDSFSEAGFWQGYLAHRYSFDFIHSGHIRLGTLLKRIATLQPDAVVIQSAERTLPDLYGEGSEFMTPVRGCSLPVVASQPQPDNLLIDTARAALPAFPLFERKRLPDTPHRISEGFHLLKLALKGTLKPRKRKATVLSLNTDTLFSHRNSHQLLVLSKDFLLAETFDAEDISTMRCSMQKLQQTLSSLGLPHAILALPDKTTAYQPYLADDSLRQYPALISALQIGSLPQGIDMLPAIRQALARGERDLYLPNDTHWGHAGYQLAAALVSTELERQGLAQRFKTP